MKSIWSMLQSLLGLWTITLQCLGCFPRKASKADLSSLLPTFDLVVAPSTPPLTCNDVVVPAEDNSPSNSSWKNDKAQFIRSPSLKRASVPRKPVQRNSKTKARHLSKGYGGIPKAICPAISTPDPESGTHEWTALGFRVSESSESVGPSMDLSPSSTTSAGLDNTTTRIVQETYPRSSDHGKRNDHYESSSNSLVSEIVPALVFPDQCYPSNPLSALSGQLYDAAPNVVLRSIPVPQLAKSVTLASKRETLLEPPYPELFDFSLYNNRSSRRSDLLVSPQLNISEEKGITSDTPGIIIPSSPDSCKTNSPASLTLGLGISTPPLRVKKRFGVCTTPKASIYFGTASILNASAVLPKSTPPTVAIVDEKPPPLNSKSCTGTSGGKLSSLQCTEEELLGMFTCD